MLAKALNNGGFFSELRRKKGKNQSVFRVTMFEWNHCAIWWSSTATTAKRLKTGTFPGENRVKKPNIPDYTL